MGDLLVRLLFGDALRHDGWPLDSALVVVVGVVGVGVGIGVLLVSG